MARPGPKLSENPGKTAKYYRSHPKARKKHQSTNKKINDTPAKKSYRRDLMRIRRKRKPGSQTDMSHQPDGSVKAESRKANRGRGGASRS